MAEQMTRTPAQKAEYLTAEDYAQMVGVSAVSVRRMCARGEIPAVRVGSRWRIPVQSVSGTAHEEVDEAQLRRMVRAIDAACEELRALKADLQRITGEAAA